MLQHDIFQLITTLVLHKEENLFFFSFFFIFRKFELVRTRKVVNTNWKKNILTVLSSANLSFFLPSVLSAPFKLDTSPERKCWPKPGRAHLTHM